jgi:hypothetical protein
MEETLKKLVNTMVLRKYGLSCEVLTYKYASDVTGYLFLINSELKRLYPLFDEFDESLDNILMNVDFVDEIVSSVRYLSVNPMDIYNQVFYRITDPEVIPLLTDSIKETRVEIQEETNSDCFSDIHCEFVNVFEEKRLDSDLIISIEDFCDCPISQSFVGLRPFLHFVFEEGNCKGPISTSTFFRFMSEKNQNIDFMIPKKA